MTRLRRQPRTVYRVYDEEEYLAGADALAARDATPSQGTKHGGRRQRIAGAAALTGAVGAVGGVLGLAVLRAHATDRRVLAEHFGPPMRAAARRRSMSISAGHATRRYVAGRGRSGHMRTAKRTPMHLAVAHARRSRMKTSAARAIAVSASYKPVHRSEIDEISDRPASAAPSAPAEPASVSLQAPAATDTRPRAQSEFGFER
jgi:hypothetical protein